MKLFIIKTGLLFLLCFVQPVYAVLQIEITKGSESALPIAIIPFEQEGLTVKPPADVADIIASDLQRSGKFSPVERDKLIARPQSVDKMNFKLWKVAEIDHVVIGQIKVITQKQFELQFRLVDIYKGEQVLGYRFMASDKTLRSVVHHISDLIYEQITGQKGAFDTRIAYITAERKVGAQPSYKLQVADTDGYNAQTILTSSQPIMSPSWSPDGSRIAYVSFENAKSEIYIQHLITQKREKIAAYKGINGAPVWSPDGRSLALTLSKGGNPDIYVMDLKTKKLTAVTRHWGIDTEPAWMPDSRELVFTSSRTGKPQLYRTPVNGGKKQRLTYEGRYNANAEVSPDGRSLVYVSGEGNVFKIAVMDLETGYVQQLTDGNLDESPSFAPNGSMILYATQAGGQGVLAAVSTDGRFKQRLVLSEGDVREPTWAPFKQ
ncbi:MAG: Tol-Pal system beta propeller repeat protein TolB [Gammaproteobacteria bacterium]|nr:Tol-Pal system beta propeller repeat protein TolB [Gammaproteobacteria bacterium]